MFTDSFIACIYAIRVTTNNFDELFLYGFNIMKMIQITV